MTEQRIRVLTDTAINQIAAGEVIENPASVVKELVENAIDSGALEIFVETRAAGRSLIKVMDDGCGMSQDDLVLSVERHATSKIRCVDELNSLRTLGFRGEALPSIASVSKMSIHSALESNQGYYLHLEGGKIGKLQPLARVRGTTVEVKSLFFNVPVRKKFQKSIGWDTGEIHKILIRFSLSYPKLGITWVNDEKHWISFSPYEDFNARIKTLLGEEFLLNSLNIHDNNENVSLSGKISVPTYHRPNRAGQYLFINQRAVVSSFISNKILQSYGTRLDLHRYPLFVLHLDVPPSWVDVNVHPQKKEIRFCEEEKLATFIIQAMEKALSSFSHASESLPPVLPLSLEETYPILQKQQTTVSDWRETPLICAEPIAEYKSSLSEKNLYPSQLNVIAKVKNYLLIQESNGIRVVDISRAVERLVFEELNGPISKMAIQTLLIPIQITVTGKEKQLLCEYLDDLNARGISIRPFGGDTFIVDAIPSLLEPNEIPDLIFAYLEEGAMPRHLEKCIKRKEVSLEMGAYLIEKLFTCESSDFTPSGKRIHYLLDENALNKLNS